MLSLWKASFLSGNSWGPREGDTGAVRALLWDGQHLSGGTTIITFDGSESHSKHRENWRIFHSIISSCVKSAPRTVKTSGSNLAATSSAPPALQPGRWSKSKSRRGKTGGILLLPCSWTSRQYLQQKLTGKTFYREAPKLSFLSP